MRTIKRIIVHCSLSDIEAHDNAETIKKWHTDPKPMGNGWNDIGYHVVITKKGIEEGRPVHKTGAHCYGHNRDSIGICLTGDQHFTEDQFNELRATIKMFKWVFGPLEVEPHNKYSNKTCPNFDLAEVLKKM